MTDQPEVATNTLAHIRPMTNGDLLALEQIDPNFVSATFFAVERQEQEGGVSFHLVERAFDTPFHKETGYRYDFQQLQQSRYRLAEARKGQALMLVAEADKRLVAVLEVEPEPWRGTALIWALFVDRAWRGKGVGRNLLARAEVWATEQGCRAIVLETQTNNVPAIRFYHRHGYHIAGLDTHFYSNGDVGRAEVALFMYKELIVGHR